MISMVPSNAIVLRDTVLLKKKKKRKKEKKRKKITKCFANIKRNESVGNKFNRKSFPG